MTLRLTSPAFDEGAPIPPAHGKEGGNASPPLAWSGVPEGTKSFAILCEDPDAPSGTFRHWGVYDIPADRTGLDAGEDLSRYGRTRNDFGDLGYGGPRPPAGDGPHRYQFRLAALSVDKLDVITPELGAMAMWNEALRNVVEETVLTGTFEAR